MHYFLFGKGVISEFSYSLDNREDTNLTLDLKLSPMSSILLYSVISFGIKLASGVG